MKDIIEKRTGLKLKDIPKFKKGVKFGGHVEGKTYYCGYWRQTYKVIDIVAVGSGWAVVCEWQGGEKNAHSTSLIPGKDFEVITA